MRIPSITPADRRRHLDWLKQITILPTAAGLEDRIITWIDHWLSDRPGLRCRRDGAGNLIITTRRKPKHRHAPIFITAHLDHPAFVVREVRGTMVELEFRGGVHDAYFEDAKVEVIDGEDRIHPGVITRLDAKARPFKRVTAKLGRTASTIRRGDIGRWKLPKLIVRNGQLHANACDDLAAVAAALAVMDKAHTQRGMEHIGLLFTRAEEVGFVGAIAACKLKSVPKRSRLICLESSRSFPESPIGAGPIVRVGDRISVFGPTLTNAISDIMLAHTKKNKTFKWQRKLMPGGACEATAFSTYGYQSTCVCLPLGNYHNMRDIDGVLGGKRPARVGQEYISIADYHGLIELLLISCTNLDEKRKSIEDRLDGLLRSRGKIVGLKDMP